MFPKESEAWLLKTCSPQAAFMAVPADRGVGEEMAPWPATLVIRPAAAARTNDEYCMVMMCILKFVCLRGVEK